MATRTRSRTFLIGAAVAALLAPVAIIAAVAGSASAAVGPRPHEVYMYKVEKHVDLSGEYPDNVGHEDLSCNDGDYVLDGMWRVDHVDYANPQLDMHGDERDVYFDESYPDDIDKSRWHFSFENYADGNAQIKLFLTCIRQRTEENAGHRHDIVVTNPGWDTTHHDEAPGDYQNWIHANACPSGSYAVAPGFSVKNGHKARIFGSWPTDTFRSWQWAFVVEDDHTDIDVTYRCLSGYVANSAGHRHQLPMTWRPYGYNAYETHLSTYGIQERRLSCDDGPYGEQFQDYKAMVGAFWTHNPHHHWFLGMDPRPKTRAYSYFWDGVGDSTVSLNVLCVKSRTGKQIKPL
jgi:hypothetical protein